MGKPVGGICSVSLDGERYDLRGDVEVLGDISREGVKGLDGVHGYLERPEIPGFNLTLSDSGGLSLDRLKLMKDVTLNLNLINGKQYILRNAWSESQITLNPETGEIKLEFRGVKLEELLSS